MRRLEKVDYKAKMKLSYDPDDVNVRLQHFRVSEIVSMIGKNALDILNDDFELMDETDNNQLEQVTLFDEEYIDIDTEDDLQRKSGLWNNVQKSQFIESLMIKLPIPLFYFDGSRKPWRVIDGLQRLHTIMSFIRSDFKLVGLEYLIKECEGVYFTDERFPGYLKRRVLDAEIIAYVINPGTPPDVKYNIFKRINTGGLKLNGQEIRNAFFRGEPANFTKKLALEPLFKQATNNKVPTKRMIDREYANRFIAFQVFDYYDYNGKMDLFLSEAMMDLYERKEYEFEELHRSFLNSMERCYQLFNVHAFYRPKSDGNWGRQPNKALFDTISWNLNEISDSEFSILLNRKEEFQKKYIDFMNNDETMFKSINDTTGSKSAVINRFKTLNDFIKEFIQ